MSAAARIRIGERTIDVAAGAATIGRAPGQTVRIVADDVAPEHAVLHLDAAWTVEARGGELTVDGEALRRGGRRAIAAGARLAIGAWQLVVEAAPPASQIDGPLRTVSIARELIRDLLGGEAAGGAAPTLHVERGPAAGQTLPLPPPPGRLVIGRGEGSDVVILDGDLSRQHVAFDRDVDGVRVVDLGSKNGTRVGGRAVPTTPPGVLVRSGDEITCGATALRLHDPADDYLRELDARLKTPPGARPPRLPAAPAPPGLAPIVVAAAIAAGAVVALILLLV